MAVSEYINVCTSGSEISKNFYAILNGYTESYKKNQTVETNTEGNPLVTNGGITRMFSYVLKLTYEVEDNSFGTKNDLITFYNLNNPNGTPSDILTLTDHYGISYKVKFIEELDLNPLTTMLDGEDSFFYTPIKFIEVIDE